jgi:hypothetical protein
VIPRAAPQVTLQPPTHVAITAGDSVSFTATTTGSPVPTVQWQVSTVLEIAPPHADSQRFPRGIRVNLA